MYFREEKKYYVMLNVVTFVSKVAKKTEASEEGSCGRAASRNDSSAPRHLGPVDQSRNMKMNSAEDLTAEGNESVFQVI